MTETPTAPLIRIIVGSVRPVRVGDQIAAAVAEIISDAAAARTEIIDLVDLDLPLLDEPRMPALGDYQNEHTKEWARIVDESDAVVFVTPQYNAGYPASLKNAIDYLFAEWKDKPSLIISYGGHGGGMSGAQLRAVLEFIGLDLVGDNVEITLPRDSYGPDWRLTDAKEVVAGYADELRTAAKALDRSLVPQA
ncbi:NADPH-dependent FMN reductase [Brevibacterium sp. 2SA]|uniref:NADPH-dependent FMN reductase n=1 Tax=Brevibacterium sp. 2SA TaxID=2502198 RepID=UPI0010F9DA23|nr:NADPH-dependent FMN reductase [Brevibacterium sp. 2SA]